MRAVSGSANHGAIAIVGNPYARTQPTPTGLTDAEGVVLHVFDEDFVSSLKPTLVGNDLPDPSAPDAPDVHVIELCPNPGERAGSVLYVRADSPEWPCTAGDADKACSALWRRVQLRSRRSAEGPDADDDGAASHASPAGGVYMATGSATRGQRRTAGLPRGSVRVSRMGRSAPYRHKNHLELGVREVTAATAPLLGGAATVIRKHLPLSYAAMWQPAAAAPLMGMPLLCPSHPAQDGRQTIDLGPIRAGPPGAAIPCQHIAVRLGGAGVESSRDDRQLASMGLASHHVDSMDARRAEGMPILFVPRIRGNSRTHKLDRSRPMPSADLILAEDDTCTASGARAWRVVTCVDGYVCLILAHYERQVHGNVWPVGRGGRLVDDGGVSYLSRSRVWMPPGVQLLRVVCYNTTSLDSFAALAQQTWDESAHEDRVQFLRELVHALDAPLDARLLEHVVASLRPKNVYARG